MKKNTILRSDLTLFIKTKAVKSEDMGLRYSGSQKYQVCNFYSYSHSIIPQKSRRKKYSMLQRPSCSSWASASGQGFFLPKKHVYIF